MMSEAGRLDDGLLSLLPLLSILIVNLLDVLLLRITAVTPLQIIASGSDSSVLGGFKGAVLIL